uniref:Uncharacterized protein n=1 Tax=Panagrolaimus davidi TaxID=227884 RepID=A0A914QNN5_9BILA
MFSKDLINNSCYKLMIYLGFCDLHTSIYIGIYAGYISITGNVYCHWPKFAFWMGCGNGFAWKMQSTAIILLAFNRCIEAFDDYWSNLLFNGKKVYIWMFIPFLWGSHDLIWGPPGLYSPILSLLSYNPHVGYIENPTHIYIDTVVLPHNIAVAALIFLIYGIFGVLVYAKTRNFEGVGKHTKVFGQILFISLFLFMICIGYLIPLFIPLPTWLNPSMQYTFLLLDGQPAIIYLTLNSNMRDRALGLFGIKFKNKVKMFTITSKTASTTDNIIKRI